MKYHILNTTIALRNHDSWYHSSPTPTAEAGRGPLSTTQVQPSAQAGSATCGPWFPRATSSWVLSIFKNGDFTFPGNLFQCSTALHNGKVFSCVQTELPMFPCIPQFSHVKLQFSKMIALLYSWEKNPKEQ